MAIIPPITNGKHQSLAPQTLTIDPKYEWLTTIAPGEYAMVGGCLVGLATFTPAAATEILANRMTQNRKPNTINIRKLAVSMTGNSFRVNGETIVFDVTSNLRNGMHRMLACVESQRHFQSWVIAGVPEHVFVTFDQHSRRSADQILGMRGEQNHKILAGALTLLHVFLATGFPRRVTSKYATYTIETLLDLLEECAGIRQSANAVARYSRSARAKMGGPGQAAFFHYVLSASRPGIADQFLDVLASNTTPDRSDLWVPAKKLNQELMDNVARGGGLSQTDIAILIVKAWNHFCTRTPIKGRLTVRNDEEIQPIDGLEYVDGLPVLGSEDE